MTIIGIVSAVVIVLYLVALGRAGGFRAFWEYLRRL